MPKTLLIKIQVSDESDMEALAGQVDALCAELEDPEVPVMGLKYSYLDLSAPGSDVTEWLWAPL